MKKLTAAEEEIMKMLWDQKEATVSMIIESMPNPKPPHSSISSIVRILEKKGFVDHKAFGRSYVYFPIIKRQDYSKNNLREMLGNYFEGSVQNLVSFLVNEKEIDTHDLKNLLEELENKKS